MWSPVTVAASLPSHVVFKTSPSPIVAPSDVTFIVVTPKGNTERPTQITLTENETSHESIKFSEVAPHEFAATASVTSVGTLELQVLDASGKVLFTQHEVVKKAPPHWGSKIIIGGLFLLGSLYYWRRMQKFSPRS